MFIGHKLLAGRCLMSGHSAYRGVMPANDKIRAAGDDLSKNTWRNIVQCTFETNDKKRMYGIVQALPCFVMGRSH